MSFKKNFCRNYIHSKNGYVMQNASLEFFVEVTQKFVILTEKFVILM